MRLSVVGEPSDEPLPCVSVEPPPEPHAVILSAIVLRVRLRVICVS